MAPLMLLAGWEKLSPHTWCSLLPLNPKITRMCHDERFLNLWIKDCPFTLNYITDLPRYVDQEHCQTTFDDKSGYDHIQLHPSSPTYFGLEWGDDASRTPHFPSAGKLASIFIIRWVWLQPALLGPTEYRALNILTTGTPASCAYHKRA